MVPVVEQLAAPAERAIDPSRSGDLESLHSSAQISIAVCFRDQMQVVVLDARVHDPEPVAPVRGLDRKSDGVVHAGCPQPANAVDGTQRDVERRDAIEAIALGMQLARAVAIGRTAGATSLAAPGVE